MTKEKKIRTTMHIITELSENKNVFKELMFNVPKEMYMWKPQAEKWCLLEVVCHLYDEEREDFRARTKHVLEKLNEPLPPIDPQGWVVSRNYSMQSYKDKLNSFLIERERSINWLQKLSNPKWDNAFNHARFGKMTARMFLSSWLAHDYLHIKQITKLKYDYLKQSTTEKIDYAGDWR